MNDYSQPDFYRFSEDSLKLVKFVIRSVSEAHHILDMGAGSGIIGIELANHFHCPVTLLEMQDDYKPHLEKNIQEQLQSSGEIILSSFGEWVPDKRYDLIVANPPYYLPGHGEPNSDERKNRARAFVTDDWKVFLDKINLAMDGRAFLVIRNDPKIRQLIEKSWLHEMKFTNEGKLLFIELFRLNKN